MTKPIRFLHISDTHFGTTKDFIYHEKNPFADGERLVLEIKRLPFSPDFIIHSGDVVSLPSAQAYEIAKEVLGKIEVPLYFVTGNHDDPTLLQTLPFFSKGTPLIDDENRVSYFFEVGDYLFITLDAKHTDDENPSGYLPLEQLHALEALLESSSKNFAIFTHFPPLRVDAPWIDDKLIMKNGARLHECLIRHTSRCMGVFVGHIHQSLQIYADGICYFSVPSNTFQFGGWPTDSEIISYNPEGQAGMGLVTFSDAQVVVKQISFRR